MNAQRQKMKMQQKLTPQQLLLQRLLQVPGTLLDQQIKEEVEKNPLLEMEEPSEEYTDEAFDDIEPDDNDDDFHGIDLEEYWDEDDYSYRERQENDPNQKTQQWESADGQSFSDYLLDQLRLQELNERERAICNELVGSIDGSGYLGRDIALITNDLILRANLDVNEQEVEHALSIIQQLDPAGVGARSLQECLSLQLHRRENPSATTALATTIIDKYFDHLANKRYDAMRNALKVSDKELNAAIEEIQRLNPKPGWGRGDIGKGAPAVIPDFVVARNGDQLTFALTDKNRPKLRLNNEYIEMLDTLNSLPSLSPRDKETVQYIKTNRDTATLYIDTLQQREATLSATMNALLRWQRAYFLTGNVSDLKPMKLKDIADATGYDESTISRVVNQKYVQTDFGTFLLKELFSKAVTNDEGDTVGMKEVHELLRSIIAAEDKRNPLTDEALTQLLNDKGFSLSRRTVAKYREALNIPVARLRREL